MLLLIALKSIVTGYFAWGIVAWIRKGLLS